MLQVGVDATAWHNTRGYGRHARALLRALTAHDLDRRYTLLVDSPKPLDGLPPGVEVEVVPAGVPTALAASASGRRSLRDMWRMSAALSSPRFDLLLFPTAYSYVPVLSRARKVVMIHDVTAERFPSLTVAGRSARLLWNAKIRLARRQADAIATVSEYSRRGLVEQFGLRPERVHVVGEAADPIFRRLSPAELAEGLAGADLPVHGRPVVYVGGFGPHKNVGALLDTFARLAQQPTYADAHLVLVGEREREVFHSDAAGLEARIRSLGLTERVTWTGYLPDERLVLLLNRAAVLVLPSLGEGFGLPAVEAAACGCPVIATTASPLPELLGEGGLYVDPERPEVLERALERVLTSPALRARMSERGLAAAGRLTWEAAAAQLTGLLDRVASR
jgi:glycosyltransferase involved in cell wall biosynthesis